MNGIKFKFNKQKNQEKKPKINCQGKHGWQSNNLEEFQNRK